MSSRNRYPQGSNYESSRPYPSSDRREYTSGSDDASHRRRRYSPSARPSPPHEQRNSRTPPLPPRGPAAMEQSRGRWDRDKKDSSDAPSSTHSRYTRPQGYSHGRYRDRDQEGYRSPRYSSRSRSRSRSPRPREDRERSPHYAHYGGAPSREVNLGGLPVDITEKDIRAELEQYYHVEKLEDVRIIRDKKTGISRQFGFLRFEDMRPSIAFVEKNYPSIRLYGGDKDGFAVNISFSRERDRDNNGGDLDWVCSNCSLSNFPRRMECFRCQAAKAEYSAGPTQAPVHVNVGDSDVSPDGIPSQFLLVRGLESSVTEELLAKGIAKLYKSSEANNGEAPKKSGAKVASTTATANLGAQEGSIRRVFVVRDRLSDESWRYGFAEFHVVEDAQAALVKFNSLDKFTIASKPVLLSYVHAGVFVPSSMKGDDVQKFSFSPATHPHLRLQYWDHLGYLRELVVSETAPGARSAAGQNQTNPSQYDLEGLVQNVKAGDGKAKKRKAEAATAGPNKKALPSHMQFWKDRHAELHGDSKQTSEGSENERPTAPTPKAAAPRKDHSPPAQSYADLARKCCYLCSRQFKTDAEVNKHERLSQLHRDNLKNEELVSKALVKLTKAGLVLGEAQLDTAEYRDRAKERRQVFGQPKKPAAGNSKAPSGSNATKAGDDTGEEEKSAVPSKGASLLGKMGWSAGQGLGAQGTGMVAPIATDVYVQGVGLGAQGGKLGDAIVEAERNTKGGYEAFLERTKDGAKARFESLKEG